MGDIIEQGIKILKERLARINTEAASADFTIAADLSELEKSELIKNLNNKIESLEIKIKNTMEELDKQNMNYVNYFGSLGPVLRAAERETYAKFGTGPNGFLVVMEQSRDILEILAENKRTLEKMSSIPLINTENINVKLPEIKLPEFSGELKNWNAFYEEFKAAVEDQVIPEKRKMQYLKSALKGEPLELVDQYPLEAKNYRIVLELLQKNFGDQESIKCSLHSALRRMPRSGKYIPEIRKTLRKIESIIKQLENMGENIEHEQLILEIESKMPKRILSEIYRKKRTEIGWNLKKMLKFLDDYLKLEEDVYRIHKDFEIDNKEDTDYRNKNIKQRHKMHATAMYYTKETQNNQVKHLKFSENKSAHKCIFCDKTHWENKCSTYNSKEKRIERVKQLNICFKCLGRGHKSKDCKKQIICYSCKKVGHNSAFCVKIISNINNTIDTNKNIENYKNKGHISQKDKRICVTVENEPEEDSILFNNLIEEDNKEIKYNKLKFDNNNDNFVLINNFKKCDKNTITQTFLPVGTGRIINGNKSEIANIFLDSGCEISLILNSFAEKLNLRPLFYKKFRGKGLFNKSIVVTSPVFEFELSTQNNEKINIVARGTDDLIENLKKIDNKILQKNENTYLNSKMLYDVRPHILIGIDYLGKIMNLDEINSGFNILKTKIGNLIIGKGQIDEKTELINICQVTSEQKIHNWWELEGFGISDNPTEKDDEFAKKHFEKNGNKRQNR
uniref:CCHC-type domain-containing protein n=1 Tax=Meloidogyne enterolobii TaxID=390850 RepID=A0A6V7WM04_MELEN|nr:unnamed protein product [Meloidogyne enterolobii]